MSVSSVVSSMGFGASTLGYRFDPLETALDEIAACGFDLVDLAMYPSYCPHFNPLTADAGRVDALAESLAGRGLRVAALNATDGLLGVASQRDHAMAYARAALRLAARLGASGLTMQSGREPEAPDRWAAVATAVAADVRELGEEAAELGLVLTLELHKELLMATTRQALDLMALVDHPAVGVALDPSHASHAGERIADAALALGSLVKHVHLRDARGKDILVVPGDGEVDFAAFGRSLHDIGYAGAAVIELEYEDARAAQVTPDLMRAKGVLERDFLTN